MYTLQEHHQQQKPGPCFAAHDAFFNIWKEVVESLVDLVSWVSKQMGFGSWTFWSLWTWGWASVHGPHLCIPGWLWQHCFLYILTQQALIAHSHICFPKWRKPMCTSSTILFTCCCHEGYSTGTISKCGWCHHLGHSEDDCYTKQSSQEQDCTCINKAKTLKKANVAEETATQASVDSSSPASSDWNTDTGASCSIIPHRHWFKTYCPQVVSICLADDSVIYLEGVGSVVFKPKIEREANPQNIKFFDIHIIYLHPFTSHILRVLGWRPQDPHYPSFAMPRSTSQPLLTPTTLAKMGQHKYTHQNMHTMPVCILSVLTSGIGD